MSCPDYAISATGRQGIGIVQPQSGLDYPLIGPRIFTAPETAQAVRFLLADFYFTYDDPAEYASGAKITHPLRIKYLYGVGCVENTPAPGFPTPAHAADIVLVDALGAVVFDTTTPATEFAAEDWGADYKIYTWKQPHAVCRLVAYTTWAAGDGDQQQYDKYMAPADAILDERAVHRMPRRLRSVRTRNNGTTTAKAVGAIVFGNGYNTEIVAAAQNTSNFRNDTAVTFAATPGLGRGRYTDCTEATGTKPIVSINGVGPDSAGNFLLSGSDCLWARRPTTYSQSNVPTPSTTAHMQIGADCGPCCKCADYAAVAKYMNDTSTRYRLIGRRAENVKLHHAQNIYRWNEQRTCSLLYPLKLLLVPQNCPYVDVIAMLCNTCETCLADTALNLAISSEQVDLTVALECGYTALFATGINGATIGVNVSTTAGVVNFGFNMPQISPNDSAYVKLRLKFMQTTTTGQAKPKGPYAVTGTLTANMAATNLPLIGGCGDPTITDPATAVDTKMLYCTELGTTETPC